MYIQDGYDRKPGAVWIINITSSVLLSSVLASCSHVELEIE